MSDDRESKLAQRVRERMAALGIGQSEVARRAHVNRSFLSDLVRGRKETVREDALRRLANALHCSIPFLEGETDDPTVMSRSAPLRPRPTPRLPSYLASPDRGRGAALHVRALPAEWTEAQRRSAIDEEDRREREQRAYDRMLDRLDPSTETLPIPDDAVLTLAELRLRSRPTLKSGGDTAAKAATKPIPAFGQRYGHALRVEDGLELHYIARPLPLARWPGIYGVVWGDDGLEPRIRRGETVIAVPRADIRPGDDVVVLTRDPSPASNVKIGRLIEARRDRLLLSGMPPDAGDIVIAAVDLQAVHRLALIVAVGI